MNEVDFQGFVVWAAEEPSRSVKITIDNDHISIIVGQWIKGDNGRRDYVCQFVATVGAIDLVGKFAREREEAQELRRSEYERLAAEFGQKEKDERV